MPWQRSGFSFCLRSLFTGQSTLRRPPVVMSCVVVSKGAVEMNHLRGALRGWARSSDLEHGRAFYRGTSRTVGLLQRRLCSACIRPHSHYDKLAVRTMSRVEPLKASNDSYLRQINLHAASGAATSASVALESASALRRSSDATTVSSRGAKRMQMVDFLLTKGCKVCVP